MSKTLVYERTGEDDKYLPLIMSPENARAAVGDSTQAPFVVANSMREVQPDINILVSPIPGAAVRPQARGSPGLGAPRGRRSPDDRDHARMPRCSHEAGETLDPLGDVETDAAKNRARGRLGASLVVALHLRAGRDHGPARVLGDAGRALTTGTRSGNGANTFR